MTTDAFQLGASLYVPATHPKLGQILAGQEYPFLRSVIVCTEDALRADEVELGIACLGQVLAALPATPQLKRFVRVRNPEVAAQVSDLRGSGLLDGYVLPKFSLDVLPDYERALPQGLWMPTLETREVFDPLAMRELRAALLGHFSRILALRIGGNDLLALLGMRRPEGLSIYQTPIGTLIPQLMMLFRPYGFALTAPVCDAWADPAFLAAEVRQDLAMGLVGKTAIHPAQVPVIEAALKVSSQDVRAAERLLAANAPAVFSQNEQMYETAVHRQWAVNVLARARLYGQTSSHTSPHSETNIG
jgi:citrate lyase beta subunit